MATKRPRRSAQRQALQHGKHSLPHLGTNTNKEESTFYDAQARRQQKTSMRRSRTSLTDSDTGGDAASEMKIRSIRNVSDLESERGAEAVFYQQKLKEFEADGVAISNLSEESKAAMEAEFERWESFCGVARLGDPRAAVKSCKASNFKAYLHWRVKNSRIKKESAANLCWKKLSMTYAQLAERYMDEGVLFDMRNWIPQKLIPQFKLDVCEKEKSGLFVEDLCTLQNGHWVRDREVYAHERLRVQMSPFLIIAGCTATRPKALVGLYYSDIEFQLFRPSVKEKSPIVVMKLDLNRVKRSGGKRKKKTFAFYETENISCCAVTFMLALALADNAFKCKFVSLSQIYALIVPLDSDRLRLQWDDEWANRPVFRDVEQGGSGIRISKMRCLEYSKHRHYLIRLGRTCGYEKRLEFYDLRRASGKKLNEAVTSEERRQIMGHRGDVYERYYMPSFVDRDCQAIYLGATRRDDLVRSVGRLYAVTQDPDLLELVQKRQQCTEAIKSYGYATIKAAVGTTWYQQHCEVQANINRLKRQKTTEMLDMAIKDFHNTVHTLKVERQLQGILPDDIFTPQAISYELEDRSAVVRLLFGIADDLDEEQHLQRRIELVQNLISLSKRQETPSKYRNGMSRQILCQAYEQFEDQNQDGVDATVGSFPQPKNAEDFDRISDDYAAAEFHVNPDLSCAFCKWSDEQAGPRKRNHTFSRLNGLGRHIRRQHLQYLEPDAHALTQNVQLS